MRRVCLLVAVAGFFGAGAPSAAGLTVAWYTPRVASFTGDGCGSTDVVRLRLRRGAFRIEVHRPLPGAAFVDIGSDAVVARLTGLAKEARYGRRVVAFTATGSDDTCINPATYEGVGWETEEVTFRVDYLTHERVYFPSRCNNAVYRPQRIIIACGDGNLFVTGMRWRGWNRRVVRGWGTGHGNDCIPYCATGHFHTFPIRIRLDGPRYCATSNRYQYRRASLRYIFDGRRQEYSVRFPCGGY
jgi:hypothetical protein